jgi:hypothetical protein
VPEFLVAHPITGVVFEKIIQNLKHFLEKLGIFDRNDLNNSGIKPGH